MQKCMGTCSKGYLLPDVRDKKWIMKVLREKRLVLRQWLIASLFWKMSHTYWTRRRVCIFSAEHSKKMIAVIFIVLHSAIDPYHLVSFELHSQRQHSKFQVMIKKSLLNENRREMHTVKLHVILLTWNYRNLWIESDFWFSLISKYGS